MRGLSDPKQIARDKAAIAEQQAEWLRELAYFEIIHLSLRARDVELVADLSNQILFMIPTANKKAQSDCWFPSEELKAIRRLHGEVTFRLAPEVFYGIDQQRHWQSMRKSKDDLAPINQLRCHRAELDGLVQALMNRGMGYRKACERVAITCQLKGLVHKVSGRTIERLLKS